MSQPQITFVCCIERGRLEDQTLLMLQTLRENGGALADAPVLAVIGRTGAPLRPGTVRALEEMDVKLVRAHAFNDFPWFNYSNKVAAVGYAQEHASTPTVVWLDSDILVSGEPRGLHLAEDEDFAGRCEFLPPAVHAGSSEYVPYWERICELVGARFEDIPWIDVDSPPARIRLFFNSGVFCWRRASAFSAEYRRAFARVLRSRTAMFGGQIWFADQVVLAPLVVRAGLRWRHLDRRDHHMTFQGQIDGPIASPSMAESSIIHYSGALSPPYATRMLARLRSEVPHLLPAVIESGSPRPGARLPPGWWIVKAYRKMRMAMFQATAQRIPRGREPSAPKDISA